MRYMLKQSIFSWGDNFTILDQSQQPCFQVVGQVFSWGNKLSFQQMDGRELAFISQQMLRWMPTYEIHRDGQLFARIVKEFSWLNSTFTLDVPGPNDYEITGSFWEHEYQFRRMGKTVATASKKYWSWSDTFGIDIVPHEDVISILCSAIVIDLVLHDKSNN